MISNLEREMRSEEETDDEASGTNLIEKEFQFKTLMHWSLLHECFNITSKDHAVQ